MIGIVANEASIERAIEKTIARYPEHEWRVFLQLGVPAVRNRMASRAT